MEVVEVASVTGSHLTSAVEVAAASTETLVADLVVGEVIAEEAVASVTEVADHMGTEGVEATEETMWWIPVSTSRLLAQDTTPLQQQFFHRSGQLPRKSRLLRI